MVATVATDFVGFGGAGGTILAGASATVSADASTVESENRFGVGAGFGSGFGSGEAGVTISPSLMVAPSATACFAVAIISASSA